MKNKCFKKHLWFNIFIQLTAIFAVFISVLTVSNAVFMSDFYILNKKRLLKSNIRQLDKLDINDPDSTILTLQKITESNNFNINIYNSEGELLYTNMSGEVTGSFRKKSRLLKYSKEVMTVTKSKDIDSKTVMETAVRRPDNKEFLICRREICEDVFAELSLQTKTLVDSAKIANNFIIALALVYFVIAIFWIYFYSKKVAYPIIQIRDITTDMANLNFERKISLYKDDEIGQLSESINRLSDSLSYALEDLKAKNKQLEKDIELERRLDTMRKTFCANVSHELKTPISIINGYAEGLKLNTNPEARDEYCNIIISEGNRMNRLVTDIMQLSKYESGQIPFNPETFDISETADHLLKKTLLNNSRTFENRIPKGTLVLADISSTELVMYSLIENASSHSEADAHIETSCEKCENSYIIKVFNTKSHIPEDQIPNIWQSFYRGDASHKRKESHFGLGLSIVSSIIEAQELKYGVYNTPDGVCFWFEIKATDFSNALV